MEKKICSKCKIEKGICKFHKHPTSKSGVRGVCKECRKLEKIKNSEYRSINKEKIRIKNKKWTEENPDYMKEYSKVYNIKNREKINLKLKKWREVNKIIYQLNAQIKNKEKYNWT